jgi:hypothetical protein
LLGLRSLCFLDLTSNRRIQRGGASNLHKRAASPAALVASFPCRRGLASVAQDRSFEIKAGDLAIYTRLGNCPCRARPSESDVQLARPGASPSAQTLATLFSEQTKLAGPWTPETAQHHRGPRFVQHGMHCTLLCWQIQLESTRIWVSFLAALSGFDDEAMRCAQTGNNLPLPRLIPSV